jgi:hypothetical protein
MGRLLRAHALTALVAALTNSPSTIAQPQAPTKSEQPAVPSAEAAAPNANAPEPSQPSASAPTTPVSEPGSPVQAASAPVVPKLDLSRYLANGKIGYAGLAVEKANIQKSLADEHYLRDDRQNAEKTYLRTLNTLNEEAPDDNLTPAQRAVKKLLKVDVDYRLLNLRLGNDFWSGYRTDRPSVPHRHLLIMEGLLETFEKQVGEIDELLERLEKGEAEQAKLARLKYELEGKIKDQILAQEKGVIVERKERSNMGTWEARVRNLTGQRLAVEAQSKQLEDEQKQLSANASSMLVQAVASGAGVPPSVTTAVMTGDVKAALLQEATAQLGDANSPMSKAIGQVSRDAHKLQDLYISVAKRYEEARGQIEAGGATLKQAGDLIRKPTFESLVGVGDSLWAKLPDAERKRLTSRITQAVPTAGLLESYRRIELSAQDAAALRVRMENLALSRIPIANIRSDLDMLAAQVVKNESQAKAQFISIYKKLASTNLSDAQYSTFVEQFVRNGASDLFEMVPTSQRLAVARAMGEPTVKGAITKLSDEGLSALRGGRIQNGKILYTVGGRTSSIDIKSLFDTAALESATTGLRDLPSLYGELVKRTDQPQLMRLAISQIPKDMLGISVEAALKRETDKTARENTWDALTSGMSVAANTKAREVLTYQSLGAAVVEEVVTRPEAAFRVVAPPTVPAPSGSDTGISPQANAVATAALNYAIPGAGVAVSLAQTFAKMDANIDEMNRLADQSLRIMAEQEQLYDLATEAYFQYALAEVEQRRAEVLRDSAEKQLGVYSAELTRRSNSTNKPLAAIGLRRALTYYVAERLREEFDLFDRSYAMWNSGLRARGAIAAEIQSDPQNVRYALDSDIHLFDWLNRERESTRGDPDVLRMHWRQMLQLAKDVCAKRSCKPGDGSGALGQIAATRTLSLKSDLVGDYEWRRFKEWQRDPRGSFIMNFAMLPTFNIVPLHFENVRIVDVRVAGIRKDEKSVLSQIAITHSGISQIPRAAADTEGGIVFQREALLPKTSAAFNKPTDFDVEALRTRFDGPSNALNFPTLREFEGYGLYTTYQLTLQNTPENTSVDDITIRIAYFYHDASNIVSEERYLSSLRSTGTGLPFEIYDYRLVSKSTPSCAGGKGAATESISAVIPPHMRSSFTTAFARFADPGAGKQVDMLPAANRGDLTKLQACLETRVVKVCKPLNEIQMIAASWYSASKAPPTSRREDVFDVLSISNDANVPPEIRSRYVSLCQGAAQ